MLHFCFIFNVSLKPYYVYCRVAAFYNVKKLSLAQLCKYHFMNVFVSFILEFPQNSPCLKGQYQEIFDHFFA